MLAEREREPEEGEAQKSPTLTVLARLVLHQPSFQTSVSLHNPSLPGLLKPRKHGCKATIQAEREEAARKQEQLQAQLQAQQVTIQANQTTLEQNQNLLRQTQEDMKGMQSKFEETNALLRAMLNLQRDGAGRST
jgi:hypothetical protein